MAALISSGDTWSAEASAIAHCLTTRPLSPCPPVVATPLILLCFKCRIHNKLATRPRRPGPAERFCHVRSFEVGDHQAQESCTGRQARKNVYAHHQGNYDRRP